MLTINYVCVGRGGGGGWGVQGGLFQPMGLQCIMAKQTGTVIKQVHIIFVINDINVYFKVYLRVFFFLIKPEIFLFNVILQ